MEELPTGGHYGALPTFALDGDSINFMDYYSDQSGHHFSIKTLDLRTKAISALPGSESLGVPERSPDGRSLTRLG